MSDIFKPLNDFHSGYKKGYNDTSKDIDENPKFYLFVFLILMIFPALYFLQQKTGVPFFDKFMSALEWVLGLLWDIIVKFFSWLAS